MPMGEAVSAIVKTTTRAGWVELGWVARRCRGWTRSGVGGQETASRWMELGWMGDVWWCGLAGQGTRELRQRVHRSTGAQEHDERMRRVGQEGRAGTSQGRAGRRLLSAARWKHGWGVGLASQGFLDCHGRPISYCTRRDHSSGRAQHPRTTGLQPLLSRHLFGACTFTYSLKTSKVEVGDRGRGPSLCLCAWPPL